MEQFPLELVEQPTAHVSSDPRDAYNNILLFVVREDHKGRKNTTPTEMHIFQVGLLDYCTSPYTLLFFAFFFVFFFS